MKSIRETFKNQAGKFEIKQTLIDLVIKEGYEPFEPEAFEDYISFAKLNTRVKPASMVKLVDNRGEILVLRPDVTTSIINDVIPRMQNDEALKLFYDTDIYRMRAASTIEKTAQFGVEYLGQNGGNADREIIALIQSIFACLKLDYVLEIGNQTFLDALIGGLRKTDAEVKQMKAWIMRKNKDRFLRYLAERSLQEDNALHAVALRLFDLEGKQQRLRDILETLPLNKTMRRGADTLLTLGDLSDKDERITFDLALLSEYDYYQGIVFQGYLPGQSKPVIKGGRYNPVNKKTSKRVAAIGFTIDLDVLMAGEGQ